MPCGHPGRRAGLRRGGRGVPHALPTRAVAPLRRDQDRNVQAYHRKGEVGWARHSERRRRGRWARRGARRQGPRVAALRDGLHGRGRAVLAGCGDGILGPQVFDLHYADGSHLRGFNGVDQVWVSFAERRKCVLMLLRCLVTL